MRRGSEQNDEDRAFLLSSCQCFSAGPCMPSQHFIPTSLFPSTSSFLPHVSKLHPRRSISLDGRSGWPDHRFENLKRFERALELVIVDCGVVAHLPVPLKHPGLQGSSSLPGAVFGQHFRNQNRPRCRWQNVAHSQKSPAFGTSTKRNSGIAPGSVALLVEIY